MGSVYCLTKPPPKQEGYAFINTLGRRIGNHSKVVDNTQKKTAALRLLDGSTHPCKTEQCGGGVGRNIAEALWRLRGGRARLLTAVGDDVDGQFLADIAPGLLLDGCVVKNARTATYAAVLDQRGECCLGLGDMTLHNHITVDLVNRHMQILEEAPLVVLDGNVPASTMDHVLQLCHRMQKPVFFEPTDIRKATKPLQLKKSVSYISPNLNELRAMAEFVNPGISRAKTNDMNEVLKLAEIVLTTAKYIIITLGPKGVLTVRNFNESLVARWYPVKPIENIVNVSGAGDCFISGFICGMLSSHTESTNVNIGFQSAKHALLCKNTVPTDFCTSNLLIDKADFVTLKLH